MLSEEGEYEDTAQKRNKTKQAHTEASLQTFQLYSGGRGGFVKVCEWMQSAQQDNVR
jgi:hypothetical protein